MAMTPNDPRPAPAGPDAKEAMSHGRRELVDDPGDPGGGGTRVTGSEPRVDLDKLERLAKTGICTCPQCNGKAWVIPAGSEFLAAVPPTTMLDLIAETRALRRFEEHVRNWAHFDSSGYVRDVVTTYDRDIQPLESP